MMMIKIMKKYTYDAIRLKAISAALKTPFVSAQHKIAIHNHSPLFCFSICCNYWVYNKIKKTDYILLKSLKISNSKTNNNQF